MCTSGGSTHHYEGYCCAKGDKSAQCTPSSSNLCSPVQEKVSYPSMYAYCPMTTPLKHKKVLECSDSEMSFEATSTP